MAIAAVQNFENDGGLSYETTASITLSGTTSNNLLVAIVGTYWGTTYTTPTGWTKVEDYTNSSHQVGQATYYKVSDGTETSFSVTLGASRRWAIVVQEFSGLDSTSPFEDSGEDTTYVSTEQTNGDPIPLGSATPSTANGAGICTFTADARDARDGTLSFTDSYTTDVVHEYDWGQPVPVLGIGHKAYTTTAAQAPDADTSQNVSWRGVGCIAVYKEAGSGGATVPVFMSNYLRQMGS